METRGEGENKDETITLNNITTNEPLQHSTSKPDRTGFNVESDSDEEDTSTNDPTQTTKNAGAPSKRKPGKLGKHSGRDKNTKQNKVTVETECEQGENKEETTTPNNTNENRPQQQQTQRGKVHQQNTLNFDQTGSNVEINSDKADTGNNDPNRTTINTDETRKRKLGKSTHNIHDKDEQGRPTLGIPIQDDCLQSHITTYLKATVLYALGDGQCLRRSPGKIENIGPGEAVRKMETYCENVLNTQATLYIDGQVWYHRLANPPSHWLKLESSVWSYTNIFAGISELHIWVIITQKPVIALNAITGTATVFTPDKKVLPKV